MRARWAFAIAPVALVAASAPAPVVVGVASALKNDVRIRAAGAPIARPAMLRQRVALADQVQTGAKSQLQLLLLDRSVFTVGANARVTIDRYVYDPDRGAAGFGATVTKGAFRFMSGRPHSAGGSSVKTPVATIGIRGTIFEGVVGESAALIAAGEPGVGRDVPSDPDTASLIVLRGPGRATQGGAPGAITVEAGGRAVALDRPLLAAYVPRPGAVPIGPFTISQRGLTMLQALLYASIAPRLGWQGPADNLGSGREVWTPPPREGPAMGYPSEGLPVESGPGDGGPPAWQAPAIANPGGFPQPSRPAPTRGQPRSAAPPQQPAPAPNNPPLRPAPKPTTAPSPNNPQPAPKPTGSPAPTPSSLNSLPPLTHVPANGPAPSPSPKAGSKPDPKTTPAPAPPPPK